MIKKLMFWLLLLWIVEMSWFLISSGASPLLKSDTVTEQRELTGSCWGIVSAVCWAIEAVRLVKKKKGILSFN